MDFSFNKEESLLRKSAAEFFKKECPPSFISEMLEDEKGYSPAMWQKMADLGFIGLIFDEKFGGLGGTLLELSIIMEEMGRALLPAPFFSTVILSGLILQDFADDSLKNKYLSPLACGDAISTFALTGAAGLASGRRFLAILQALEIVVGKQIVVICAAHISGMQCLDRRLRIGREYLQ